MEEKNIVQFPTRPEHLRKKSELADYLRTIAEYIESDAIESPAVAILMVLTSEKHHEVLGNGYEKYPGLFTEAARSAVRHARCTYKRRGRNKYDRDA